MFYPFPKPESRGRESAIPKIQSPLQLALGKYRIVIKSGLFPHFPPFDKREKSISVRRTFVLIHIYRFNFAIHKTGDYFHLKDYSIPEIRYTIHTLPNGWFMWE